MAKFVFTLDPLMRVRVRTEQACQRAVAALDADRMDMESRLRALQDSISGGKESLRDRLTGPVAMHDLRLEASASMQVLRRAQRLVLELAGVHQRLEAARADLRDARAQRRALELVRERRLDAWKNRLAKAEDRALDDVTSAAVSARSREQHAIPQE